MPYTDTLMYAAEPYRNCVKLQRLIMSDADLPELKAKDRAALARAFCDLEETKRKLKMKPLPGSLRPTESKSKRKPKEQVSFTPAPVETGQSTPPVGEPDPVNPV